MTNCKDTTIVVKIDELVNQGLNFTSAKDNQKLLGVAVESGNIYAIKYLIDKGADVNAVCNENKSVPLHEAVKEGQVEVAKALLRLNAKVDPVNKCGKPEFVKCLEKASSLPGNLAGDTYEDEVDRRDKRNKVILTPSFR